MELSLNLIGDDGASAIAHSLKVKAVLTTLDLNDKNIRDEGAAAISETLNVNVILTNLNL